MKYHITNNAPATHEDIARVEAELGLQLPSCLYDLLLIRSGFQVYKNQDYEGAPWLNDRSIHATHAAAIVSGDIGKRDFGQIISSETERLRDLYMIFAKEEDSEDDVEHDPSMMDNLICVGKREDISDEQFSYWMRSGKDCVDVYCIEMPLYLQFPHDYEYPPPIREHLEEPLYTWDNFLAFMDKESS